LGFTISIALWGTILGAIAASPEGQRFGTRRTLGVEELATVRRRRSTEITALFGTQEKRRYGKHRYCW
jgi:hypothetical protein